MGEDLPVEEVGYDPRADEAAAKVAFRKGNAQKKEPESHLSRDQLVSHHSDAKAKTDIRETDGITKGSKRTSGQRKNKAFGWDGQRFRRRAVRVIG